MKEPASSLSSGYRVTVSKGFTLMETVIAIGVLAVLLTGFLAVFTPAAQGIRRSISTQQADRLASTLERELVTLRGTSNFTTGFEKAFEWIQKSNTPGDSIFVYQYRGNSSQERNDGTPEPMKTITGQPGEDYVVQSIARRRGDPLFQEDLEAIEGPVFYVKATQLIYGAEGMTTGSAGKIVNPSPVPTRVPPFPQTPDKAADYSEAVIPFSAEFHSVPTKSYSYLTGSEFATRFNNVNNRPVFTRNLAVRR